MEYADVASGYLRTSNWLFNGLSPAPLLPLIAALQNAAMLFSTSALPVIGTATPVGGQYHLCQDVALLNFATVPGTSIQLAIPGPVNSVFGANSTVVDSTNPAVAALIAAVIGLVADPAGNAVTAYISGSKGSRRTEQL